MSRTVAIVQARIASSRLPGKVLYELAGRPLICLMIDRLERSARLDDIVVATGDGKANDAIASVLKERDVAVFRGSESDVLARYAGAAAAHDADIVVRLTADCPLMDADVVDRMIAARERDGLDFCTNVLPPSWPDGLDVAVFTSAALDAAHCEATLESDREHVVPWMWRQSNLEGGTRLRAANISAETPCPGHRWTVDEAADYRMVRALAAELGPEQMVKAGYREIVELLERRPEIRAINTGIGRDEGLAKSRALEANAS